MDYCDKPFLYLWWSKEGGGDSSRKILLSFVFDREYVYPLFSLYLLQVRFFPAAVITCVVHITCTVFLATSDLPVKEVSCWPPLEFILVIFTLMRTLAAKYCIALVFSDLIYTLVAVFYHLMLRRTYLDTDSLRWEKEKVDQRLSVVIPPKLLTSISKGQYPQLIFPHFIKNFYTQISAHI